MGIVGCCTWGISEMEAIRRTWEESWMFGEDTSEFAGGGADEFLSGEEDGPGARGCREEKGEDTLVFL